MNEKFKINMDEINKLIDQYQSESNKSEEITQKYVDKAIELLGTSTLKSAISTSCLSNFVIQMLNKERIHESYTDEEVFKMLEGLSNHEIVGDWQYFLTVETKYLFELPKEMQEKFADNFSIGNSDAKDCLLSLWENKIETTGTDIVRTSSPRSTNNITIRCQPDDLKYMIEALRKIFTC